MHNPINHEDLGFFALKQGHFPEAVNIFRRALDEKKTARAYFGFGIAHDRLEDFPTARWAYYKALDIDPQSVEIQQHIDEVDRRIAALAGSSHPKRREVRFRALKDTFEVLTGRTWKPLFVKAINLGLAPPGSYPGEYAIRKGTYRAWFEQMQALGFNAVRIYTLHPPAFYEALYEFNEKRGKLFLLQGIWAELPDNGDFGHDLYLRYIRQQITEAVDGVFGSGSLPERPGYPHGTYTCDVSPCTLGFIVGREWESCPVAAFNSKEGRRLNDFHGSFIQVSAGTPFENWIGRIGDFLLGYESSRYGTVHPLSTICWPTLDPLVHPSESRYEDDLHRQGQRIHTEGCNENEDVESLDPAKFKVKQGAGFFATYHAYPYYPDFMNNDYLDDETPYLSYLSNLRRRHGRQPVIIGEFGVPSSREVSHWHVKGWHHGGHNEVRQGEINGEMMLAIHRAGLAGGAVFSWFDEWFKKNWLFMAYELPPDRNALWFNFQDAEQNYGLIAAYPGYPGRMVSLSGNREEWQNATPLSRKEGPPLFLFDDGGDDARTLARLAAQHDEGFFYLRLETRGKIDFSKAHYVIGLDTCDPSAGEFVLPFNLNVTSPLGLKFIIHLCGAERSRILVCPAYDKYLNAARREIHPGRSFEGAWIVMQNRPNVRRTSKDGRRFYPSRVVPMSNLRQGSLDPNHRQYDSLADFFVSETAIELRIPWGLIQFTDPSSKTVLWKKGAEETRKTDGIRAIACSFKPESQSMAAVPTGRNLNAADMLPLSGSPSQTYTWKEWDAPLYHFYTKRSAGIYQRYLEKLPS